MGLLAIAIVCILAAPFVIEFAVVIALSGAMIGASTVANAAPGGGLPPEVSSIWNDTFGRAFGNFLSSPPYPGEGIDPPGDCSTDELKILHEEQKVLCGKKSSCNGADCDSNVIQEKISNANACIGKRLELMKICFRGGDSRHWDAVGERMKGVSKCTNCLLKLNSLCK